MGLKNRRGAFAIITAILFMTMVMVGAVALDFSRLWTLKNELQISADAAAHAGAIALQPARYVDSATVDAAVRLLATANEAMSRTPVVDSVELGTWTGTFARSGPPYNAVRVVTAFDMSGLIMSALGMAPPRIRARAVGWAQVMPDSSLKAVIAQ